MARPEFSAGYLAGSEASHLSTQALPGAVVLHLRRNLPGELAAGQTMRQMFVELTVSEAVQFWQQLGDVIRAAGAKAQQAAHADAAVNL